MGKLSFKKSWREGFAYGFLMVGILLNIYFLLPDNCSGPGCLFGFGLIAVLLFFSFIFIVITLIKNRFVRKNIVLGTIWLFFSIILFSQVHIGSTLDHGWMLFNKSDICFDNGGTWNYKGHYCEIAPEAIIKDHILDMTIPVPETEGLYVTFNDIKQYPDAVFAYGEFAGNKGMEKGSIAGYFTQIKKVSRNLFVMPFSVDFGGSGTFFYMGLFHWKVCDLEYGRQKKEMKYLDGYFLGDRIHITNVDIFNQKSGENKVVVDYLDYKESQTFAETPQNSLSAVLSVEDNKLANAKVLPSEKLNEKIKNGLLGKMCTYGQINIPLWNSSGYEAVITYKNRKNKINFFLKNGYELFIKNKNRNIKIMEFSKIAPGTVEMAICYMAYGNNDLPAECVIKRIKPNRWELISSKKNRVDYDQYVRPSDDSVKRYFTILNGFVLTFINIPDHCNNKLIDLESVEVYLIE